MFPNGSQDFNSYAARINADVDSPSARARNLANERMVQAELARRGLSVTVPQVPVDAPTPLNTPRNAFGRNLPALDAIDTPDHVGRITLLPRRRTVSFGSIVRPTRSARSPEAPSAAVDQTPAPRPPRSRATPSTEGGSRPLINSTLTIDEPRIVEDQPRATPVANDEFEAQGSSVLGITTPRLPEDQTSATHSVDNGFRPLETPARGITDPLILEAHLRRFIAQRGQFSLPSSPGGAQRRVDVFHESLANLQGTSTTASSTAPLGPEPQYNSAQPSLQHRNNDPLPTHPHSTADRRSAAHGQVPPFNIILPGQRHRGPGGDPPLVTHPPNHSHSYCTNFVQRHGHFFRNADLTPPSGPFDEVAGAGMSMPSMRRGPEGHHAIPPGADVDLTYIRDYPSQNFIRERRRQARMDIADLPLEIRQALARNNAAADAQPWSPTAPTPSVPQDLPRENRFDRMDEPPAEFQWDAVLLPRGNSSVDGNAFASSSGAANRPPINQVGGDSPEPIFPTPEAGLRDPNGEDRYIFDDEDEVNFDPNGEAPYHQFSWRDLNDREIQQPPSRFSDSTGSLPDQQDDESELEPASEHESSSSNGSTGEQESGDLSRTTDDEQGSANISRATDSTEATARGDQTPAATNNGWDAVAILRQGPGRARSSSVVLFPNVPPNEGGMEAVLEDDSSGSSSSPTSSTRADGPANNEQDQNHTSLPDGTVLNGTVGTRGDAYYDERSRRWLSSAPDERNLGSTSANRSQESAPNTSVSLNGTADASTSRNATDGGASNSNVNAATHSDAVPSLPLSSPAHPSMTATNGAAERQPLVREGLIWQNLPDDARTANLAAVESRLQPRPIGDIPEVLLHHVAEGHDAVDYQEGQRNSSSRSGMESGYTSSGSGFASTLQSAQTSLASSRPSSPGYVTIQLKGSEVDALLRMIQDRNRTATHEAVGPGAGSPLPSPVQETQPSALTPLLADAIGVADQSPALQTHPTPVATEVHHHPEDGGQVPTATSEGSDSESSDEENIIVPYAPRLLASENGAAVFENVPEQDDPAQDVETTEQQPQALTESKQTEEESESGTLHSPTGSSGVSDFHVLLARCPPINLVGAKFSQEPLRKTTRTIARSAALDVYALFRKSGVDTQWLENGPCMTRHKLEAGARPQPLVCMMLQVQPSTPRPGPVWQTMPDNGIPVAITYMLGQPPAAPIGYARAIQIPQCALFDDVPARHLAPRMSWGPPALSVQPEPRINWGPPRHVSGHVAARGGGLRYIAAPSTHDSHSDCEPSVDHPVGQNDIKDNQCDLDQRDDGDSQCSSAVASYLTGVCPCRDPDLEPSQRRPCFGKCARLSLRSRRRIEGWLAEVDKYLEASLSLRRSARVRAKRQARLSDYAEFCNVKKRSTAKRPKRGGQ
ncbi:unnamed protein product [Sympodiomycopsis kandeliae]